MTEPVTVIGLGPMGQALASAYAAAGRPTTAWTRSDRPAPDGVTRAATAADAVSASKTVVVCLLDYDAVRAVLHPLAELLRGRLVVNLTSGNPDAARDTAAWAADQGITYVDGAIMTPTYSIGAGQGVFLHCGPTTDALAGLGGTQQHLGPEIGAAAAYDVALLDLFWTSVGGMVHAFALAASEGIAPRAFAPLAKGIGDLMPVIIDDHAAELAAENYAGTAANLRSMAAGVAHITEASEARGVDARVIKAVLAMTQNAVDAGHGDDGVGRLTALLTP